MTDMAIFLLFVISVLYTSILLASEVSKLEDRIAELEKRINEVEE